MHRFTFIFFCLIALSAQAHEAHGIEGASHYHASDVWGFVMAIGVVAFMWWLNSRNK